MGHRVCEQLMDGLLIGEIIGSQSHQPSGSSCWRSMCLLINMQLMFFNWCGFQCLQNSSRVWLRIFSIVFEEELKVLDLVEWLNYYYFVLLDSFPLCLHFLTSMIKFALWDCKRSR